MKNPIRRKANAPAPATITDWRVAISVPTGPAALDPDEWAAAFVKKARYTFTDVASYARYKAGNAGDWTDVAVGTLNDIHDVATFTLHNAAHAGEVFSIHVQRRTWTWTEWANGDPGYFSDGPDVEVFALVRDGVVDIRLAEGDLDIAVEASWFNPHWSPWGREIGTAYPAMATDIHSAGDLVPALRNMGITYHQARIRLVIGDAVEIRGTWYPKTETFLPTSARKLDYVTAEHAEQGYHVTM